LHPGLDIVCLAITCLQGMVGLDIITIIATGYRCNVIAGALETVEIDIEILWNYTLRVNLSLYYYSCSGSASILLLNLESAHCHQPFSISVTLVDRGS
jgi:hypothetical protein